LTNRFKATKMIVCRRLRRQDIGDGTEPRGAVMIIKRSWIFGIGVAGAVLLSEPADAQAFRIEGEAGATSGQNDVRVSEAGIGTLEADSLGGTGIAGGASIWLDGQLFDDLSLGARYLHTDNSVSLKGLAIGDAHFASNAFLVDAAWRINSGSLHPFIGIGAGMGLNQGGATGWNAHSEADFAGDVFAGFDYDLSRHFYVGIKGEFFYTSEGAPRGYTIAASNTNRQTALTAHFGLRFQ
jgi:hypothetical protein